MTQVLKRSKPVAIVLSAMMLVLSPMQGAGAALVDTRTALEVIGGAGQAEQTRARLAGLLAREDVRRSLEAFGVDPGEAEARVAAMADEELASVAGRMESLPAGGSALGAVALVFLILIILDILGVTDIFTFIRPQR